MAHKRIQDIFTKDSFIQNHRTIHNLQARALKQTVRAVQTDICRAHAWIAV